MPDFLSDVSLEGQEWIKTQDRFRNLTAVLKCHPWLQLQLSTKYMWIPQKKKVAKKKTYDDNGDIFFFYANASLKACRRVITILYFQVFRTLRF